MHPKRTWRQQKAVVTEDPRLVLSWRGKEIVNLSRAFLDTNGAHQETTVAVDIPNRKDSILVREDVKDVREKWLGMLKDLNVCSQKGLVEMFDGSIGQLLYSCRMVENIRRQRHRQWWQNFRY